MTGTGRKRNVIGGLAEIALRVNDLQAMKHFYQSVIGLEVMRDSPDMVFFRIADGFAGHTQILALFDRRPKSGHSENPSVDGYQAPEAQRTSIDHLAFAIARDDFESERERLIGLGYEVKLAYHQWVQWRSLYLRDPEQNLVELVCFDPQAAD